MKTDLISQSIQTLDLVAGVDWITLTVKKPEARVALFDRYQKLRTQLVRIDNRQKKFAWHGYAGLQIAGARWGTRKDSDILILSGVSAGRYWKLFAKLAENVTRLDLAVTASVFPPIPHMTSIYYDNLDAVGIKRAEIRNREGGGTLYVGSRTSSQFGRIYDKGAESSLSPIDGVIWRYEIEYKDEHPKKVLNRLLVENCPRRGIAPLVISHVYNWFDKRNIPPVFKPSGYGVIESHIKAIEKDEEKTLAWFRTQVSPAVRRLIGHRRTDVLEALGLGEASAETFCPSI